jgi:hypothetical protein
MEKAKNSQACTRMMGHAMALLRKSKVYIQSYSKPTGGVWIAQGLSMLPVSTRSYESHSRQGIPHPKQSEEWKAIQARMLEATGARSWGAMAKGSKAVGL